MRKLVLILVGLPGSGKTTVADFFKSKDFPVVRMGEITDEILREKNLPPTCENEKLVREALRQKYGEDIYARKVAGQILLFLKENPLVVIDGMRSEEEYKFFKKTLPQVKVLFIEAGEKIRHLRLTQRKVRPLTVQQAKERDMSELTRLGLYTFRKSADFIVNNEVAKSDLYKELNGLLKKL